MWTCDIWPDLLCCIESVMRLFIAKLPMLELYCWPILCSLHADKAHEKRITGFSLSLLWVTMVCTNLSVLESISNTVLMEVPQLQPNDTVLTLMHDDAFNTRP